MASPGGTVSGSGVLAWIDFDVVGAPGSFSALDLSSVLLNDGAIPVQTTNGSFIVDPTLQHLRDDPVLEWRCRLRYIDDPVR